MQDTQVSCEDNKTVDFYCFVEMLSNLYSTKKVEMEHHYKAKEMELAQNYISKEETNKNKMYKVIRCAIVICVVVCLAIFVLTGKIVSSNKQKMDDAIISAEASHEELEKFMQKWEIITDFKIAGEKLKENYVMVDQVSLEDSVDFYDVVNLSFEITHNGVDFYVLIDKTSMFTIVLKDGSIIETPCYNGYGSYSLGYSQSTKTLKVKGIEFSGFSVADVAFVKMTNLQIKRIKYVYGEKPLLTDYEIVLYKAD